MTDRILGFQVVLLDEHLVVERRIPDVYYTYRQIVVGGQVYDFQWDRFEEGTQVRYFKRVPDAN